MGVMVFSTEQADSEDLTSRFEGVTLTGNLTVDLTYKSHSLPIILVVCLVQLKCYDILILSFSLSPSSLSSCVL